MRLSPNKKHKDSATFFQSLTPNKLMCFDTAALKFSGDLAALGGLQSIPETFPDTSEWGCS